MEHTKGPWKVIEHEQSDLFVADLHITDFNEYRVLADINYPDATDRANARLIAAAPELLEALKEIHKLSCCPEPKRLKDWAARCDVMADYARSAIAKAEG